MTNLPVKIRERAWIVGALWAIALLFTAMFTALYITVSPLCAAPASGSVVLLGMAIYETVRLRREIRTLRRRT